MTELDGDDYVLKNSCGEEAERDMVEFFAYDDAIKCGNLEEEVLKEIPSHVCEYMWGIEKSKSDAKAKIIKEDVVV